VEREGLERDERVGAGRRCANGDGRTPAALDAVIFDMDGVLVDSEPVHVEATRSVLADHGVAYRTDRDENFYGCTDRELFRALRARYRLAATEDDMAEQWIARVVGLLARPLAPMAGVPGVLQQLRAAGLRLALASSSAPAIIAATLAGLGLSDTFDLFVSGHAVGRGKPAPDIFVEAVRRLGVGAEACLVIEDSSNGVVAAAEAGIRCVAIPCPSTAGQDFSRATVRLDDLTELPAWIGLPSCLSPAFRRR
jgi:HAD superfamily hydrolase (TIGR01509 family)